MPEVEDLWQEEGPLLGYKDPETSHDNPNPLKEAVADQQVIESVEF